MNNIRETLENGVPVYKTVHWKYIRISDLKEEYERNELTRWSFGKWQPLIQGEKGAIIDAIFLSDYLEFLELKNSALT